MGRVISPISRAGVGVAVVALQHAAGALRRNQRDAQIAAQRMVRLHAHGHVLADQRVGHGEKVVRRFKMNLRQRVAVRCKQIFQRHAVAVADEHRRDGREVRPAHGNELIAARRAAAARVGGKIINHREGGPGLRGEIDLVSKIICAALDQRGLVGQVGGDRVGGQPHIHQRQHGCGCVRVRAGPGQRADGSQTGRHAVSSDQQPQTVVGNRGCVCRRQRDAGGWRTIRPTPRQ